MDLFILISLIFSLFCGILNITRQLQMLQQNSYFPSRYSGWLKDNLPTAQFTAFFVYSTLLNIKPYFLVAAFSAVSFILSFYYCLKNQKKSIKKLAFTARVKRQFAAVSVIYLLLLTIYIIFNNLLFGRICMIILLTLSYVTPLTTYLCWAVTAPIEKLFAKHYINDAKKILKSHKNLKVIGVTGSYGKTTTKFILTRILSEKFNTVCTPHSFNTPMGVVRTVREHLKPQTQIFVCEMGAKNVGDIKEICDIVHPDIALITSVGAQHLETFKTVDNVFKTKFELADAVKAKGGNVFVNGDSKEIASRVKEGFILYGTENGCSYKAENISYGRNGSEFDLKLGEETVHLTSRLLGLHSIINITGAAALAYSLGVTTEEIKFAVASLKPTEHRLEMKISINGAVMRDDA